MIHILFIGGRLVSRPRVRFACTPEFACMHMPLTGKRHSSPPPSPQLSVFVDTTMSTGYLAGYLLRGNVLILVRDTEIVILNAKHPCNKIKRSKYTVGPFVC